MHGDAVARVRDSLMTHGRKIDGRKPDDFMAQCPAHGEQTPSLHVSQGRVGALLQCFGNACSAEAITSALGLTVDDLFDEPRSTARVGAAAHHPRSYEPGQRTTRPTEPDPFKPTQATPDTTLLHGGDDPADYPTRVVGAVCVYPWKDATGTAVALQVRRVKPDGSKGFVWCHADGTVSTSAQPLPPAFRELVYRLPELRSAIAAGEELACVVEGEKDADTLRALGFVATCNPNGAGKWTDAHGEHLRGVRRVAIFADNDRPGRAHAEEVRASLARVLPDVAVRIVTLDNEHQGYGVKDVTDLVAACDLLGVDRARTCRALHKKIADAFAAEPVASLATAANSDADDEPAPATLGAPRLPSSALYGPLGEWVRLWEPHTEATPVALYMAALAALGAMIGRGPFFTINATPHHGRLFVVLVGPSGRARKGLTVDLVKSLVRAIDPLFAQERIASGLATTEGLIHHLRDGVPERTDAKGKPIPAIPGTTDKRLVVDESELASVLAAMKKPGNDLSATLRSAWDGVTLRRLTKGDPMTASDPHIAIIGAITPVELRDTLTKGDVFNGFANRLLPVYASAERDLPFPDAPDEFSRRVLEEELRVAVQWARARRGEVPLAPDAASYFTTVYSTLSRPDATSETLRTLQQRAAPYVRRMALLLALLDRSTQVTQAHIEAAVSLWTYCVDTWRVVFPSPPREGLSARLEAALRAAGPDGLSREALRTAAGSGDIPAAKITQALHSLRDEGLVVQLPSVATGGRPKEMWRHAWRAEPTVRNENAGVKGGKGENPAPLSDLFSPDPLSSLSSLPSRPADDPTGSRATTPPLSSHSSLSSFPPARSERSPELEAVWFGEADEPAGAA